jgi:uncharacterized protein YdiU (UPF0061 family)
MLNRLGVTSRQADADIDLVNLAFRALAEAGEGVRWEPFFFDWFAGDARRALGGPRAGLYGGEQARAFRERLAEFEPDRPERLSNPYFAQPYPEELLIDEIEALWAAIASHDDWTPFNAKLAAVEQARQAWALS